MVAVATNPTRDSTSRRSSTRVMDRTIRTSTSRTISGVIARPAAVVTRPNEANASGAKGMFSSIRMFISAPNLQRPRPQRKREKKQFCIAESTLKQRLRFVPI